jgi:hypothetical protein
MIEVECRRGFGEEAERLTEALGGTVPAVLHYVPESE